MAELERGAQSGNKEEVGAAVCQAITIVSRNTGIPYDQVWDRITRDQFEMILEAARKYEDGRNYNAAICTNAATGAAIAAAFSKHYSGTHFRHFLAQFKRGARVSNAHATTPPPGAVDITKQVNPDDWEEF